MFISIVFPVIIRLIFGTFSCKFIVWWLNPHANPPRAERATDILTHHHRRTNVTGGSIGDGGLELWWNFFVNLFFDVSYSPGPTSRAGPMYILMVSSPNFTSIGVSVTTNGVGKKMQDRRK